MPQIRPFVADNSPENEPDGRRAGGQDFGNAAMYKMAGRAMNEVADVVREHEVREDVTNVHVAMAKARSEWDVALKNRAQAAPLGDQTLGPKFMQDFGDNISKVREGIQTKQGQQTFDRLAAELTGHFTEKTGLWMAAAAGQKAKLDWDVSVKSYATSVSTDPTSYGSVLAQATNELRDPHGQYGRLDAATRTALETTMRDRLAQSYVWGLVDNGAPELAKRILEDGKLDDQLDPKDKQRLINTANQGITAKRVAAEHQDALDRKAEKDRVAAINDDLMGQFVAGKLNMDTVRNSGIPAFGEGSQHTWISMLKQQAKDWREAPARTSSAVYADVLERIRLPYGDPRKLLDSNDIYKLYGNGLSSTDTDRLVKKLRDDQSDSGQKLGQVIENFMKGVKPQLDKSTMNKLDGAGSERMYQFRHWVEQKVDEVRQSNKMDPRALFNPESKEYVGKMVPAFQSGPQRMQSDISGKLDAAMQPKGVAPRAKGESIDAYLKRTTKP